MSNEKRIYCNKKTKKATVEIEIDRQRFRIETTRPPVIIEFATAKIDRWIILYERVPSFGNTGSREMLVCDRTFIVGLNEEVSGGYGSVIRFFKRKRINDTWSSWEQIDFVDVEEQYGPNDGERRWTGYYRGGSRQTVNVDFVISDRESILLALNKNRVNNFAVRCDGCPPDLCRASAGNSQSKCINCQRIKNNISNISTKLDFYGR